MGRRIVYYHEDEGKKCEADTTDVTAEEPEKKKKKKFNPNEIDVSAIKPYWIKASAGQTVYGVFRVIDLVHWKLRHSSSE